MSSITNNQLDLDLDLHIATMLNQADCVSGLLHLGADPHAQNASGTSVLDMADFLNRVEVTKRLLGFLNPRIADADTDAGEIELLKAIRQNRATTVHALLEMGVRENQLADREFYRGVLLLACCMAGSSVVEVLVKYGPGVSVVQNERVLVQVALAAGNSEVVAAVRGFAEVEREARLSYASAAKVCASCLSSSVECIRPDNTEPRPVRLVRWRKCSVCLLQFRAQLRTPCGWTCQRVFLGIPPWTYMTESGPFC